MDIYQSAGLRWHRHYRRNLVCEAASAAIVHEQANVDQTEEIFLTDKNKS